MADFDQDVVIACCSLVLAAADLGAATILNGRKKRKHSTWVKPYIIQRESFGAYNALLSELATDEVTKCVQYLRMDIATFEELFLHVEELITRRTTKFR